MSDTSSISPDAHGAAAAASVASATAMLAEGVRYERGGVTSRARAVFEEVARLGEAHPALAAEAWWRLANMHRLQSNWDEALEASRAGAALAHAHGLADVEADAVNIEGAVWMMRADYALARERFTRMLEIAHRPGTRGNALQNLGGLAAEQGDYAEAERLFAESREAYLIAGDARGEAVTLLNVGRMQLERGDAATARATLEEAANSARQSGDLEMHAAALLNLGMALGALDQQDEAEERITTAYGQFTIADIPVQRVRCLMELARSAAARGESDAARVCLEHGRRVAEGAGLPRELKMIEEQLKGLG